MSNSDWTRTGHNEISLMAREDFCEVFDFAAKKRITMTKEGPAFSLSETCFSNVSGTELELAQAAAELLRQGGADHSAAVQTQPAAPKHG